MPPARPVCAPARPLPGERGARVPARPTCRWRQSLAVVALMLVSALAAALPGRARASQQEADPGPLLREGRALPARRAAPASAPATPPVHAAHAAHAASGPIAIELRVPTGAPVPAARASAPSRRAVATGALRDGGQADEMEALRQRISERLRQLREREEAPGPARKPATASRGSTARSNAAPAGPARPDPAHAGVAASVDALDPGEVRVDAPPRHTPVAHPATLAQAVPAGSRPDGAGPIPAGGPGGGTRDGHGAGQASAVSAASAAAASPPGSSTPPSPAAWAVDPRGLPWAYAGPAGPQAWGRLKPEYALCARGQRQSPIALRDGLAVDQDPLGFDYPALPITVHDTGHGLEVTVRGQAALLLRGDRYPLVRISLHRPGQGSIDGRRYPMSVQLLHRDGQGRQVMLALMVEAGAAQPAVQQVLNNLPLEPGSRQAAVEPLALMSLLPAGAGENAGGGGKPGAPGYWAYMGSLTEPPCTEGVLWIVLKQPITMSPEQLALFQRLHADNARPEQPTAGRRIKVSR